MSDPIILPDGETVQCGFTFYEGEGVTGRCKKLATETVTGEEKELANKYWSTKGLAAPFRQGSKYVCDSHAEDVRFIADLQEHKENS